MGSDLSMCPFWLRFWNRTKNASTKPCKCWRIPRCIRFWFIASWEWTGRPSWLGCTGCIISIGLQRRHGRKCCAQDFIRVCGCGGSRLISGAIQRRRRGLSKVNIRLSKTRLQPALLSFPASPAGKLPSEDRRKRWIRRPDRTSQGGDMEFVGMTRLFLDKRPTECGCMRSVI